MEKVILKLIEGLDRAVYIKTAKVINCKKENIRLDWLDGSEYEIENGIENNSTEIIEMLEKELPNMLKYCKQTSISPEVELLIKLFEETINKYGLTKDVSYSIGYYAAETIYYDETYTIGINLDTLPALAERCKPWLYWLYKYYPKKEGDDAPRLKEMPRELGTEPARKYFARAVKAGLMEKDFKWKGTTAQLGYFCSKAYKQPRPINSLENFFNVKKLSSAITNAETVTPKRADVIEWRKKQDEEIFYD